MPYFNGHNGYAKPTLPLGQGADGLPVAATAKPYLDAIGTYVLRWQTGSLFGCLKSRGGNFEDTHVTDRHRIYLQGTRNARWSSWPSPFAGRTVWANGNHGQARPIKIKNHHRPAKSIFRLGLDISTGHCFSWRMALGRRLTLCSRFLA